MNRDALLSTTANARSNVALRDPAIDGASRADIGGALASPLIMRAIEARLPERESMAWATSSRFAPPPALAQIIPGQTTPGQTTPGQATPAQITATLANPPSSASVAETSAWQSPLAMSEIRPVRAGTNAPPAIEAKTLAALAADVYLPKSSPPPGFRVAAPADLAKLNLTSADLVSAKSPFKAQVYVERVGDQDRYVIAFRGSTPTRADWAANGAQAIGKNTDHYANALKISAKLARLDDVNYSFVGHSLGGGLASAAAIATGRNATTFNAAGLSDATVRSADAVRSNASSARAGAVSAFYIRGEVLSAMQDGGDRVAGALFGRVLLGPLGGIVGGAAANAPSAYGTRMPLDPVRPAGTPWYGDNAVSRHGMDWVAASLAR